MQLKMYFTETAKCVVMGLSFLVIYLSEIPKCHLYTLAVRIFCDF